jgi:signal transduction histidine kinase
MRFEWARDTVSAVTRRQQAFDIGLALAVGIGCQVEVWGNGFLSTHRTGPRLAMSLAYLVGSCALVVRRRWPLACVLTVSAALVVEFLVFGAPEGFGVFTLTIISAYSVAAYDERRPALIGLGALAVVAATWTARDPVPSSPRAHVGQLVWFSPVLIAWLLGVYLRTRRLYVGELRERAGRLEREREDRALAAVADERARIARELHDVVGHSVSVMTVQASAVRRLLRPDQNREREALLAVERTGREAMAEMRRMVGVLRHPEEAPALAPQPSLSHIDRLVDQARRAGLKVELQVEGEASQLPPGVDLTAYRLVQEGLTNTLKHARATRAAVLLRYGRGAVDIVVSDDGKGAAPSTDGGHGLVGIRERVAVYGGELAAGPMPGGGYELRAHIPIAET